MENDSIRAMGSDTIVDIWIDGKVRSICVVREAIGAFLGFDQGGDLSENQRCEFVRLHLPLVVAAAKARLQSSNPAADQVVIDAGDLPRQDGRAGDRRKAERRKTERRKVTRPGNPDRRRGDRRKGERRRSTKTTDN